MYGSQEKILGQKVNVKFFTVDPYSGGTRVPRTFSKLSKIQKNIFLNMKTSKIKSEKNIYQTIHNTRLQLSVKFIPYMADPLHLYYEPDLASNLLHIEDSQQIFLKYNLLV